MVASMAVALLRQSCAGLVRFGLLHGAGFGLMVGTSSLLGDLTESFDETRRGSKRPQEVWIPGTMAAF